MPALPLSDETLTLITAVRDALAEHLGADFDVDERKLFGTHAFMVNDKLCIAVKHEKLLVRLPPGEHASIAETPGVSELDPRGGMLGYFWIEPDAYATGAQWRRWVGGAVAFNPRAKASPRRRKSATPPSVKAPRKKAGA